MTAHMDRYRGVRWVTVTCDCGWVSENHRSRGEARRAWEGHRWLAAHNRVHARFGVDARRRAVRP